VLPDGEILSAFPATLLDVSAGGIGFLSAQILPPESLLEVMRLFEPLVTLQNPKDYLLEVCWCRSERPFGYRTGALFKFQSLKDHDRVAKIINQLQVIRLSRYCRSEKGE